jgi:Cu/Ag efflux protein CusF
MPALLALLLVLGCGASQTSASETTSESGSSGSPGATGSRAESQAESGATESDSPEATDERSPRYTTRGTVEEIREERRQIIVHHEAIPGYMPEMTMPFLVEDLSLLQGLAAGQRIELTFSVEPGGRHVARAIRRL